MATNNNKIAVIFGFLGYIMYRAKQNMPCILVNVGAIGTLLGILLFFLIISMMQYAESHGRTVGWWLFGEDIGVALLFFGVSPFVGIIAMSIATIMEMYSEYKMNGRDYPRHGDRN